METQWLDSSVTLLHTSVLLTKRAGCQLGSDQTRLGIVRRVVVWYIWKCHNTLAVHGELQSLLWFTDDVMWLCCGADADRISVSSRYSSTSTLCPSVAEMPLGASDDAPPPLPPRQRRRGSSHGPSLSMTDSLMSPPPPTQLLPPLPTDDSTPPIVPRRPDLVPPPLPPRRLVHDHGVPPSPSVFVARRHTVLPSHAVTSVAATQDADAPQLPPKTYRQSQQCHVGQSSS